MANRPHTKDHTLDFPHILLLVAFCLQFYILGINWFCQQVVYPLFSKVGAEGYTTYHRFYTSRIPLPVILPGFASFVLPLGVLLALPDAVPVWMAWLNAGCGVIGFLVTVLVQIPRHGRLERGGRQDHILRELVLFNWPRTLAGTASAGLTLAMVLRAFAPV